MGFFSWRTSNTNRSIPSVYSNRKSFEVIMIDDKGNGYKEAAYEGYGVFGGKDYYQLVAEMNNADGLTGNVDNDRTIGISLVFDDNPAGDPRISKEKGLKLPILVESFAIEKGVSYEQLWQDLDAPEECDQQGFFYHY